MKQFYAVWDEYYCYLVRPDCIQVAVRCVSAVVGHVTAFAVHHGSGYMIPCTRNCTPAGIRRPAVTYALQAAVRSFAWEHSFGQRERPQLTDLR